MSYARWFSAFFLLARSLHATAQTTEVVCASSYAWASNNLDQSPCLVDAYLQNICQSDFDVQYIGPGYYYTPTEFNGCTCSTVVYSLIEACSACQGAIVASWETWSSGCTSTYIGVFPETIPSETRVPAWAYLDPTTNVNGTWSATVAEADTTGIESTGSASQTTPAISTTGFFTSTSSSSFGFGGGTTFGGTTISVSIPTSSSSSSHKISIAAPVAGAVVGGLIVLAIIVGLVIYIRKRDQRRAAAAATTGALQSPYQEFKAQGVPPSIPSTPYTANSNTQFIPSGGYGNYGPTSTSPPAPYTSPSPGAYGGYVPGPAPQQYGMPEAYPSYGQQQYPQHPQV